MIPYLKHKKDGAAAAPIESIERKPDGDAPEYDALESAAEDLCNAIEAKDYPAAASALRAAFEMMESEPHEEAIGG